MSGIIDRIHTKITSQFNNSRMESSDNYNHPENEAIIKHEQTYEKKTDIHNASSPSGYNSLQNKSVTDDDNKNSNSVENQPQHHPIVIRSNSSSSINSNTPAKKRIEHLGVSRQYWRDMILGVNDGLISTFLLVAGVAGGGLSSREILLTAIAGSIAGAVSMCAGEYVATKSQNEVLEGELKLEKIHIHNFLDEELLELSELIGLIGIPESDGTDSNSDAIELRKQLLAYYRNHPDSLLQIMTALEFGVIDKETRSPIRAGIVSGILFTMGALPSVLPFIFSGPKPYLGLIAATCLTVASLFLVGAVKTWATRASWLSAAIENLVIAGFGGAFAYAVGLIFDTIVQ